MSHVFNFIYEKIGPVASKIATQKHLLAIRDGLILIMPLTIVGSIFIIIGELPIPAYQDFMIGILGKEFWGSFVWSMAFPATMGISALIAVFGITFSFVHNEDLDGLPAAAIAVGAYFFLLDGSQGVSSFLGAEGLFVAIVTALVTGEIYTLLLRKNIIIHLPDSVPPTIMRSFVALIPSVVILFLFFFVKVGFSFTSFGTVHNFIIAVLQAPLMGISNTFIGTLITSLSNSILWTFGLHGDQIVGSITGPITTAAYLANVEAFKVGLLPPYINCDGFSAIFLNFGGTGSILGLVIACKVACKSKAIKQIANVGLIPSIFNISEPIVFGLPIVLNPIMMIPFVLTSFAVTSVAYLSFQFNLVNRIIVNPPWTTPIFASGFLATGGDWRAIILQLVLLAISFGIYLPFVKYIDNSYLSKEMQEK